MISAFLLILLNFGYKARRWTITPFLYGFCFWSLYLYIIVELLSVGANLTSFSLWTAWLLLDIVLATCLLRQMRQNKIKISISTMHRFIVAAYAAFTVAVIIIASHIVPYNWDSMVYHNSRIINWANNQSIAHFACTSWRQVASPVYGEFVNLNAYLLYQKAFIANDGLFNLLQTVSYLINAVLVYAIARKIGCKEWYAVFASGLFLSAPICFAEAMSTQVDEFAAVWMLAFILLALDIIYGKVELKLNHEGIIHMVCLGLTAGFGYLTKPSVMIGDMLFAVWLVAVCLRRHENSLKTVLIWCTGVTGMALILILPEVVRNLITFHAISYKQVGAQQLVGTLDIRYLIVNFLKNLFYNLPYRYWPWLNSFLFSMVYGVAGLFGIDANDASISEFGYAYKLQTAPHFDFDTATNPVIVTLLLICIFAWLIRRIIHWKDHYHYSVSYSIVAVLSFFAICILCRWEEFMTRYIISFLAAVCPVIMLEFQKCVHSSRAFQKPVLIFMVAAGLFCSRDLYDLLYYYYSQTYFGSDNAEHDKRYFVQNPVYENYAEIQSFLQESTYQKIGLEIDEGQFEYPLLHMMAENNQQLEYLHVNVKNDTSKYENIAFQPDCIILITYYRDFDEEEYVCHGRTYRTIRKIADSFYIITP